MFDHDLDFPAFALTCARAFGALLHQTEPTVSDYHEKARQAAEAELAWLEGLTDVECETLGRIRREEKIARLEQMSQAAEAENAHLRATLCRVEAWEPPTPEHEGLKAFMREQLESSMNDENWYGDLLELARLKDAASYFQDAIAEAREDVLYHADHQRREEERVAERVEWLRQLRASLGR